ncbi:hypothetical protein [Fulvimarina sp. MAC8]|uniref:hypothetical protein n=1 Tax=Fulvimarina sp. MAC8 TaxID=3162874 RepID=UPI0032EBA196
MINLLTILVVIVFFLPISFIYGCWRARGLKANHGTLKACLTSLLPMPLLFATCGAVALVWASESGMRATAELVGREAPSQLDTGNGVLDAVLAIALWLGQLELFLFMIAIPYLMGAIIAAILLLLDDKGRIELPMPAEPTDPNSDEG